MELFVGWTLLISIPAFIICLNLLPWFIARGRRHMHSRAIFWLSFALGWTIVAWIAALLWSLNGDRAPARALPQA